MRIYQVNLYGRVKGSVMSNELCLSSFYPSFAKESVGVV